MKSDDPRLPAPVRERWKILDEKAHEKMLAIQERIGPQRHAEFEARRLALIHSTEPTWVRLRALYQLVEEHLAFYREVVACRRGCSHCCHIAVGVAKPEAEMIGAQIKRKPKTMSALEQEAGKTQNVDWGYHNPCTFLKNGECSIYENRPFGCRVHYNVDEDDLLCRLDGPGIPVPYLDVTRYHWAYIAICGLRHADIRAFFPRNRPGVSPGEDANR